MNFIYKPARLIALAILLATSSFRADSQTAGPSSSPTTAIATPAAPSHDSEAGNAENLRQRPYLVGLICLLLGVGMVYVLKRRKQPL